MFRIVIPARENSSRLPGKLLADVHGKPLIQLTYEQALLTYAESIVIATDSEKIQRVCEGFGATVCLTRDDHVSGTSRIAEVCENLGWSDDAIVVNVQGDEPMISPAYIREVVNVMQSHNTEMATLCTPITDIESVFNPNIVKVLFDRQGKALLFSRAPIPWDQKSFPEQPVLHPNSHFKHIGIYGYRVGFLKKYVSWEPTTLEQQESLEQLRALWYGANIHLSCVAPSDALEVNTPEDLEKLRQALLIEE